MTDRYALFGNPLGHSKSPLIHNGFAKALGHDVVYSLIEAPLGGFAPAALAWRDSGAKGCNITAPFKLDAFALATHRMERAEQAGSANCLKFEPDGRILAPVMPYHSYSKLTDADARALAGYLKGLKPLRNQVPAIKGESEKPAAPYLSVVMPD